MVDYGEQTTGTKDEHYNLISVLYHALSGADTCERYALDAETAGDERLAAFFRETQTMQTQIGRSPTGDRRVSGRRYPAHHRRAAHPAAGHAGGCGTGDHIGHSDRPAGGGRTALRRFPAGRGVAIEGGATTWGGEAREAWGRTHNTADPAGRTATRRGEAREGYPA